MEEYQAEKLSFGALEMDMADENNYSTNRNVERPESLKNLTMEEAKKEVENEEPYSNRQVEESKQQDHIIQEVTDTSGVQTNTSAKAEPNIYEEKSQTAQTAPETEKVRHGPLISIQDGVDNLDTTPSN